MKVTELRIGNWVCENELVENEVWHQWVIGIGIKEDDDIWVSNCDIYKASELHPIPLTKKWLKKFGFKKGNNGNYWIDLQAHYLELVQSNEYWYPVYVREPEMSYEDGQRVNLNRIKYVHEIQNLYFVLAGKDF